MFQIARGGRHPRDRLLSEVPENFRVAAGKTDLDRIAAARAEDQAPGAEFSFRQAAAGEGLQIGLQCRNPVETPGADNEMSVARIRFPGRIGQDEARCAPADEGRNRFDILAFGQPRLNLCKIAGHAMDAGSLRQLVVNEEDRRVGIRKELLLELGKSE